MTTFVNASITAQPCPQCNEGRVITQYKYSVWEYVNNTPCSHHFYGVDHNYRRLVTVNYSCTECSWTDYDIETESKTVCEGWD